MSEFTLKSSDRETLYQLYLYAFNAKDSAQRQSFWQDRFNHSIPYGIKDDQDQIINGLMSIPFNINFFGAPMKMNGISDVMSAPEASGKGGASNLMKASLQDMYKNQVDVSYLAPFSFEYYRRFGYEQVFNHTTYTIESDKLPRIKASDSEITVVRSSLAKQINHIKELFNQSELSQQAGLVRDEWWWEYLTKKYPNREIAVAFKANIAVGYLLYERSVDAFTIYEVVSKNASARQSLWQFVTKHGTSYPTFRYESANPTNQVDLLANPYPVQVESHPYMMARIVNFKQFMEKYPVTKDIEEITFSITDDVIKENQGTWTLSVSGKQVHLNKISDETLANSLTIQQLAKSLFNFRSLTSQIKFGAINEANQKIAEQLDQIVVTDQPILADYF
ncbi:GNAT family N-acetyltransferase [Pediococcus argentinicus]|uniref:N-acetyltransferase domain-containing protein n=1 Tax=Pediococcus argentinicus TaxID=480391 RepID=A0A0R2NKD8_9LACO|nr:GNAT family N-acetyltransferase [Pediococcus argentinicus]KRO25314.1 hypothetical protein IV88_GL000259 [Pediococcus argentinicus]NKZ22053.1 GNAT family N-acetyltransferase [Pediococcus argentinicus]GEP19392.1 GNAT family acetyltransferase [Pediococcus argentinicus]